MRLWDKRLIKVLPRQQLLSQYRELIAIKGSIIKKGTPNHILVNKVLDYDFAHFYYYCNLVVTEMEERGYKLNSDKKEELLQFALDMSVTNEYISFDDLYKDWHNERYLRQCLYNLQEKYDCGGIFYEEWIKIEKTFKKVLTD